MRAFKGGRVLVATILLPAATAAHVAAQSPFIPVEPGPSVGVELIRPAYSSRFDEGVGGLTGQIHLSTVLPISSGVRFVAEIPLAHFDPAFEGYDGATSKIGNPYVGIRFGDAARLGGRFGVRLPLATADDGGDAAPLELAVFGDYDRIEAFMSRVLAVGLAGQMGRTAASGLVGRVVLGADMMVSTEGGDPELFAAYGAQTGYERNGTAAIVSFTGRAIVTEDLSLAERTIHQITLSGAHRFGSLQPTLWLRIPVDGDLSELIDYAVGFSMRVGI